MAKKKVEPAPEAPTPCFRKYRPGRIESDKAYVKYYDSREAAAKDQNKRLEREIYEFKAVT